MTTWLLAVLLLPWWFWALLALFALLPILYFTVVNLCIDRERPSDSQGGGGD